LPTGKARCRKLSIMSTEQPLTPDQIRSPDDATLVEKVLGSTQADEMRELTNGSRTSGQGKHELELSAAEQGAATKIEGEVAPNKRRAEYIKWADDIGKDIAWIDETFVFEIDGRVRVDGDLNLSDTGISELPPGLYDVTGRLILANNTFETINAVPEGVTILNMAGNQISIIENISNSVILLTLSKNKITKIENISSSVTELGLGINQISVIENIPDSVIRLSLRQNNIRVIENIPESVTFLDLGENPIESLEPLVGKTFDYLRLVDIPAKIIPEGINTGSLILGVGQKELIEDAGKKGYKIRVV